jgi:hypothetical protein
MSKLALFLTQICLKSHGVELTLIGPRHWRLGRWPWELVLDRRRSRLEVLLVAAVLRPAASCVVECRQNALRSRSADEFLAEERAASP